MNAELSYLLSSLFGLSTPTKPISIKLVPRPDGVYQFASDGDYLIEWDGHSHRIQSFTTLAVLDCIVSLNTQAGIQEWKDRQ